MTRTRSDGRGGVLVKRVLRAAAFGLVVQGAIVAFTGGDPLTARILLILGLVFAVLALRVDRAR